MHDPIRLAMLGMVPGNGHPYSWSAIFNGFDPAEMAQCPYPIIADYLGKQPKETLRIPGAQVTHIWTDDPQDAVRVARASLIPNVVARPEDVIGHVDAVIIATDRGHEHVARCRPFVEAGLPVFIDKPMVDNEADLKIFMDWVAEGRQILSSSSMRYCKEFLPWRASTHNLGPIRFASITTPKSWEGYGIHALEGIYPILGPGFISCRNTGTAERNVVHFRHRCGADVVVIAAREATGAFGLMQLLGTAGWASAPDPGFFLFLPRPARKFHSVFKGPASRPFPFEETVELMNMLIAGIRSREQGGREIILD